MPSVLGVLFQKDLRCSMNEFLAIIERFVKAVLEDNRQIDESFITELKDQGLEEDEIEQAFTILFNLLVNRRIPEQSGTELRIRHFTEEESRELGHEIVRKLYLLQLYGLLDAADLDYLVYGYFETRTPLGDEEEFWSLLRSYRPFAARYLDFLEKGEDSQVLIH